MTIQAKNENKNLKTIGGILFNMDHVFRLFVNKLDDYYKIEVLYKDGVKETLNTQINPTVKFKINNTSNLL